MSVFTLVEKGIPLPPKRHNVKFGVGKYPFATMKVGESFLTTDFAVAYAASWYGKRTGRKFATRAVEGGVRVWRTA